jgi:hypothetical protein
MYASILIELVAIPLTYFGWRYTEWRSQIGHFAFHDGVILALGLTLMQAGIIGSIVNWSRYRRYRAARAERERHTSAT